MMIQNQVGAYPELWAQLKLKIKGHLDDAEPKEKGEISDGTGWEWGLGVADHLDDTSSISEVGETPHYILAQRLHR